jgi:hypothetical protein
MYTNYVDHVICNKNNWILKYLWLKLMNALAA